MRCSVAALSFVVACLFCSAVSAQQPPPPPLGLRSPSDNSTKQVTLDMEACSIARAAISHLGAVDDDPSVFAPIKEQIVWERLDAGVVKCDWGDFQTRVFKQGSFIEFIGYSDDANLAAVKGGFYVAPLMANDGACFLQKTDNNWRVIGCEITGGA